MAKQKKLWSGKLRRLSKYYLVSTPVLAVVYFMYEHFQISGNMAIVSSIILLTLSEDVFGAFGTENPRNVFNKTNRRLFRIFWNSCVIAMAVTGISSKEVLELIKPSPGFMQIFVICVELIILFGVLLASEVLIVEWVTSSELFYTKQH